MKITDILKKENELAAKQNERDEMREDLKRQFGLLQNCITELEETLEKYKVLESELLSGWYDIACEISVHGVENDYTQKNKEKNEYQAAP